MVDMENYWAYESALQVQSPLLAIRIILDTVERPIPDLSDTLDAQGRISLPGTLGHLCRHPQHLFAMMALYPLTQKLEPLLLRCYESLGELAGHRIENH